MKSHKINKDKSEKVSPLAVNVNKTMVKGGKSRVTHVIKDKKNV